jgi:hypothetical protein
MRRILCEAITFCALSTKLSGLCELTLNGTKRTTKVLAFYTDRARLNRLTNSDLLKHYMQRLGFHTAKRCISWHWWDWHSLGTGVVPRTAHQIQYVYRMFWFWFYAVLPRRTSFDGTRRHTVRYNQSFLLQKVFRMSWWILLDNYLSDAPIIKSRNVLQIVLFRTFCLETSVEGSHGL